MLTNESTSYWKKKYSLYSEENCSSALCYEMYTLMKLEILTCRWPEDVCVCPRGCQTVQDTDKQGWVYEVFGLQPECHWWFCLSCLNPPPPSWDSSRTWDGFHHVIIKPPPFFSCAVANFVSLPPSHCVAVIFFSFCLQQAAFWTKLLSPWENATFMSSPHFNNSTPEIRHVFIMFCFLLSDSTVEVSLYWSCEIL